MMNKIKICLSVSLCAACVARVSAEDWPFVPDAPMSWDETLHVAGDAGNDEEGSSTLKTINKALDRARPLLAAGRSVHIVIQPGVYKETLAFNVTGGSETLRLTPLRIEGADHGVIISGLAENPFNAVWEPVPNQNDIYMANWPHPFHLEVGPWTSNNKPLPGLVARSEAVARLSGVTLHPRELEKFTWETDKWVFKGMNGFGVLERPDTFAVALSPNAPVELRGKVFVRTKPGAGADSLQDIILPRRLWNQTRFAFGNLASFDGKHNLTLRKLSFQHAGTHLLGSGLVIRDGQRILIEDCRMVNNAGQGMGLARNRKLIVRRSDLAGNGYNGIKGNGFHETLFEDMDLVGNNWRSTYAGWVNWDSAAVKFGGSSGDVTFRRCSAVNNADHGFWSDGWHPNILFESCVAWSNKGRGFFLEYTGLSGGPIRVERSISAYNDYGVYISSVRNPAVLDSILYRNAMSELLFAEWQNRTPTTAEEIVLVDIRGNYIESSQNGRFIDMKGALESNGKKIAPALLFSKNLYVASSGNSRFRPSGKLHDLAGWQNWLQQNGAKAPHDRDSSFHLTGSQATITPGALQAQAADTLGRPVPGVSPPTVTTLAASDILPESAVLNATVNAAGADTTVTFDYGTTTAYGSSVTATPAIVTGPSARLAAATISGLAPGTTYHFRAVAKNEIGVSTGYDMTFTASSPPVFLGYVIAAAYGKQAVVSTVKLLARASDPDGDAIALADVGPVSANGGSVALGTGSILYTPPDGFSGSDTFPVVITDSGGASTTGSVTVNVGPAPSAGGQSSNPPKLTMLAVGGMEIRFQGIPGRSYQIQRSTDLATWSTLVTVIANSTGGMVFVDENPPSSSAFYRLVLP